MSIYNTADTRSLPQSEGVINDNLVYNTTSVKNLPQLEEVINGNLLIVENQFGTNTIDFKNFVIGPDNASFYNTIISLSTYSVSMSGTVSSGFVSLTAFALSAVNTKVGALTSNYPQHFEVLPPTIVIQSGDKRGSVEFNAPVSNIAINDINIVPSNEFAGLVNYFALLSSRQNEGQPDPYIYTITISAASNVTGNATFETKVQKKIT